MSIVTPIHVSATKARQSRTASWLESATRDAALPQDDDKVPRWMVYPPLLVLSLALWYAVAEMAATTWRLVF
jgi:hypothetical protein